MEQPKPIAQVKQLPRRKGHAGEKPGADEHKRL